jgi:hypothetical protein
MGSHGNHPPWHGISSDSPLSLYCKLDAGFPLAKRQCRSRLCLVSPIRTSWVGLKTRKGGVEMLCTFISTERLQLNGVSMIK